jgi:hypothetical protein
MHDELVTLLAGEVTQNTVVVTRLSDEEDVEVLAVEDTDDLLRVDTRVMTVLSVEGSDS